MIRLESLRWLFTAAFGATSLFHLTRCLRPRGFPRPVAENWISELLHAVMGVSMIVMVWPWGETVPPLIWVTVFTVSTGWFLARTMWSTGRRRILGLSATVMGAMAWMSTSMPAQASSGSGHPTATPGMTMAGHLGLSDWVNGILGGYLILAAFWWFARGLQLGTLAAASTGTRPLSWTSICHGVMTIGMGLTLLSMV